MEARDWLKNLGHTSTIEYIAEISEKVLSKTGLLPHTNAGSLTKKEMSLLKDTNVSLGMMLESSSPRLGLKDMPHHYAPVKTRKPYKNFRRCRAVENSLHNRIIRYREYAEELLILCL